MSFPLLLELSLLIVFILYSFPTSVGIIVRVPILKMVGEGFIGKAKGKNYAIVKDVYTRDDTTRKNRIDDRKKSM